MDSTQGLHAVPQLDVRKNYIGLVSDTTEDQHLADSAARSQPRVMSYLVGRLAAALKRPDKAAPGRAIESSEGQRQIRPNWVTKP